MGNQNSEEKIKKFENFFENHKFYNLPKNMESLELWKEILINTRFLDENYENVSLSQRKWHVVNDFYELKRCKGCGKIMPFDKKLCGYYNTCSNKCKSIYQSSEEYLSIIRKTCLEKYSVDNIAKKEETTEKVKRSIIAKYGSLETYNHIMVSSKADYFENRFKKVMEEDGIFNEYEYVKNEGNSRHRLKHKKCGHEFVIITSSYRMRINRNREICTFCNPKERPYSWIEKQFSDYIKSIYSGEILTNNRTIINPYELDVYLPDLKLAFEFNGDFWHANPRVYKPDDRVGRKMEKAKDIWERDERKKQLCIKKGIKLIVIWENDWIDKEEKIKNEIIEMIKKYER